MRVPDYLTLETTFEFEEYTEFKSYLFNKFGIYFIKEDFYNLPFTPELITKFFKNTFYLGENLYQYINWNYEFEFELKNFPNKYCISVTKSREPNSSIHTYYPYPIVLDDFIRDCIRAKIELDV